jgi:hypothetical protein
MSWIKNHKFSVVLGIITSLSVIVLLALGFNAKKRYEESLESFGRVANEACEFEALPLYPLPENRDAKNKALNAYRASVSELQQAFEPYRVTEFRNITPQEFTSALKASQEQVVAEFKENGVIFPEGFFCGFEVYRSALAKGESTGVIHYQLGGLKELFIQLAKAKISELKNIHRPLLAEEEGVKFVAKDSEVARRMPFEISFIGDEKSVRSFMTSLGQLNGKFMVVRSLKISNLKSEPPRATDAKFDEVAVNAPASTGNVGASQAPPEGSDGKKEDLQQADAAPGTRILCQVLGKEQLQVYMRIELMPFLAAKKLP